MHRKPSFTNACLWSALALASGCVHGQRRVAPRPPPVELSPVKAAPAPSAPADDGGVAWSTFSLPKGLAPDGWLVLGPFPNEAPNGTGPRLGLTRDFLTPLGGEAQAEIRTDTLLDAGAIATRAATPGAEGIVDLVALFGEPSTFKVAYAYAELHLARPQLAHVRFGSDDSAAIWINGRRVHQVVQDRPVHPDSDRFDVPLLAGKNRVLIKVENGGGGWAFAFRAYDEAERTRLDARELRRHLHWLEPGPEDRNHLLGAAFPALSWDRPLGARSVFVSPTPRVRWFGPDLEEVTRPERDGRYVALLEAETLDGFKHQRMVTFAKVPPNTVPWWPTPPGSEPDRALPLPKGLRLNAAQELELTRHVWAGGARATWRGEEAAILAAALHEQRAATAVPDPAWLGSGFVANAERQLQLRLKLDGRAARPLAKPEKLARPAGKLRAGTELQAGMKPGSVALLRKVARDWAKADDSEFVVLVARRGVVFMHEGFNGFDASSTFYPASIGKTVAGLLFARAVDQGLLTFDTPLASVFPEWGRSRRLPPGTPEITFRHCFYHVTGLQEHRSHGGLYNPFLDRAILISDIVFADPLGAFSYEGDSLNLAGKALELSTGQSVFRLLHEQLQQPFGERVTQFDLGVGDRFNAMYLAKLGQLLLQDGSYGDHRFYKPGFVKQLWPRPVAEFAPRVADKQLESGIGLSWMPDPGPRERGALGPNVVGHGAASGSTFRVSPEHELVIVVGRNKFRDWHVHDKWVTQFVAEVARGIMKPAAGS